MVNPAGVILLACQGICFVVPILSMIHGFRLQGQVRYGMAHNKFCQHSRQ